MKKWVPNLFLACISLSVTLLIAEFVLRALLFNGNEAFQILRIPRLYADYERDETEHLYKEDYWKLRYVFSDIPDMQNPHPKLGWIGNFDPDTYEHADEYFSKGKRPVLLFGDSFSQCIDSTKCFEDYLNTDTSFTKHFYLLNYGVGGYGVDQIHLLMQEVVPRFENPVVIFGMLTTDLDRSMLFFRDAPKPHFELENRQLILHTNDVSLKASEYLKKHPVQIRSYVWSLVRNSYRWLLKNRASDNSKNAIIELNKAIIQTQLEQLKEARKETVMLLFQPIGQIENEWRCTFLKEAFNMMGVPIIDTRKLLFQELDRTKRPEADYFIPNDLHPNSNYNSIIADELKAVVQSLDSLSQQN